MDKEKTCKIGALYIATLKGIALINQNSHWLSRGEAFYGKHLLFERIYNSALKDLDLAAEKFVGLFGDQCLNYDLQTDLLHKVLLKYKNLEGSPTQMSLEIEKEFLKFSSVAYNALEEAGHLTLGLDDMIMAIASSREEAVYLLQQTLDQD
jgi:DNA-binding ferritin-like protein